MSTVRLCWILPVLISLSCSHAPRVIVGSKNFTEQVLLGEIVAQQIERRLHVRVERKLNLGGTLLAHEALVKGDIDLYPEYTGTALTAVLKGRPQKDGAGVLAEVGKQYLDRWRLVWLPPLGFNDSFAMVVRGETARREQLTDLSGAARAQAWKLGMGYEFQGRPDGLAGLQKTYGFRWQGAPVAMDLGLLYPALQSGKIDIAAGNATDGMLSALDVKVLRDDRGYFPPYDCSIVVRQEVLQEFGGLRSALEELSGKISDETMRKLNYEVDGKHRSVVEVAAEWLKTR